MTDELKKNYFIFLVPSILGFMLAGWAKAYDLVEISTLHFTGIAGPFIFILCIVLYELYKIA